MRRVREQCVAQRSTEAIAQPAARRPERSEGHAQKNKKQVLELNSQSDNIHTLFNVYQ
ncbi:MAG: hypothetical protein NZ455_07010 [Bacteroidia bacterium]|nr:hypothetical protein [Bacteroidia bacterium]MDW8345392.1 hypothetical protein [Bacteroidia bacterium]